MLYIIGNKRLSVAVDSIGAELNSVKKDGKELLWQNYDGSWNGHAPVLFPFCGHCAVNIDGKDYNAPAHGMVQYHEFSRTFQTGTELVLTFTSSAETKKIYPYDFSFSVRYFVRKTTLYIDYTVKNTGNSAMYFGCGGHESFNIDGKLSQYSIEFEKEESLLRFFHDDNGYLTGESKAYPKSKFLRFKDMPVDNSETLIFKGVKSNRCKLINNKGETVAETCFKGFDNLLFWRPDGAAVICMEPWSNLPDMKGDSTDFRTKNGIKLLEAGAEKVIKRKIIY
ncbi:MAG: hypothetical protein VZQ61_02455 [Christensenellaceae bacterium]